tara:strand:+ start:176 stop:520 length:345 start_codon:yes stop_codon:yes gene_type:complete
MVFKLWLNAVLAGAFSGAIVGLIGESLIAGVVYGGITAGLASLIGSLIFRGNDEFLEPAHMASIGYSGMLGGIVAAIGTGAGWFIASVGSGLGFVSGIWIGILVFRFETKNPNE